MICKLCNKKDGKYTCPRCQVVYCSLDCFKSKLHESCSEQFYEENVLEELKNNCASEDEKSAMLELLKAFEEDCERDEEEIRHAETVTDLMKRLDGVDLDEDVNGVWKALTADEKSEFMKLVKEEKIGDVVQQWIPWWTYQKSKRPLVSELSSNKRDVEEDDLSVYNFPRINTEIKPFSTVSSSPPSTYLCYNLINILLSYSYMLVRYNGDYNNCVDLCEDIVSVSGVLLNNSVCKTVKESIVQFIADLKKLSDLYIDLSYSLSCIEHVISIILGPEPERTTPSNDYLLMFISDLTHIVRNARIQLKKEPDSREGVKNLKLLEKKISFYSSYIVSYSEELPPLTALLLNERESLLAHEENMKISDKKLKKAKEQQKPKIKVLS